MLTQTLIHHLSQRHWTRGRRELGFSRDTSSGRFERDLHALRELELERPRRPQMDSAHPPLLLNALEKSRNFSHNESHHNQGGSVLAFPTTH